MLEPSTFSAVYEIQLYNQRVERLPQRRAVSGRVGESHHHGRVLIPHVTVFRYGRHHRGLARPRRPVQYQRVPCVRVRQIPVCSDTGK